MDGLMCDDCQKKFDDQQGQLRLLDMCRPCQLTHAIVILGFMPDEPEDTDKQQKSNP